MCTVKKKPYIEASQNSVGQNFLYGWRYVLVIVYITNWNDFLLVIPFIAATFVVRDD